MFDPELGLPRRDEVEVTVFGLGFGEAAAVHVGDGDWVLVDSCRREGKNVSLSYLETIGVNRDDVKAVVATHWDLDHVEGLAEIVTTCSQAFLITPAALDVPAIRQHSIKRSVGTPRVPNKFRQAVLEYGDALRAAASRTKQGGAGWYPACALMPIYRRRGVEGIGDIHVEALSPSAATCDAAAQQVAGLIEGLLSEEGQEVSGIAGLHPNDLSIATWVRAGERHILLGADLENKGAAAGRGWQAVVDLGAQRDAGEEALAEVVKVPHHGSSNANNPMRWADLTVVDLFGVIAPWMVGGNFLPEAEDLVFLAERCPQLWVAAEVPVMPSGDDDAPNQPPVPVRSAGFVQLRAEAQGPPNWRATLGGSAFRYEPAPVS